LRTARISVRNGYPRSCGVSVGSKGLRVLGLRQFGKTRLVVRNRRMPLSAICTAIQRLHR
jgi:hypothetical protein